MEINGIWLKSKWEPLSFFWLWFRTQTMVNETVWLLLYLNKRIYMQCKCGFKKKKSNRETFLNSHLKLLTLKKKVASLKSKEFKFPMGLIGSISWPRKKNPFLPLLQGQVLVESMILPDFTLKQHEDYHQWMRKRENTQPEVLQYTTPSLSLSPWS